MSTVNGLKPFVGQVALVKFEGVKVHCRIIDAKTSYGQDRFLVQPISGEGQVWVEERRVGDFVVTR